MGQRIQLWWITSNPTGATVRLPMPAFAVACAPTVGVSSWAQIAESETTFTQMPGVA